MYAVLDVCCSCISTILHPCLLYCISITCIFMATTTFTMTNTTITAPTNTTIIYTNPNPLYSPIPSPNQPHA